jgi:hypothetical protein
MARQPVLQIVKAPVDPHSEFEKLIGKAGKPKRPRKYAGQSARDRRRFEVELDDILERSAFADLRGGHFVIAFERMYFDAYGVAVPDFEGVARAAATKAADAMLEGKFHGDPLKFRDYLLFVFRREASREQYRRSELAKGHKIESRLIGWWTLFKKESLFVDWHVDFARRQSVRRT